MENLNDNYKTIKQYEDRTIQEKLIYHAVRHLSENELSLLYKLRFTTTIEVTLICEGKIQPGTPFKYKTKKKKILWFNTTVEETYTEYMCRLGIEYLLKEKVIEKIIT